MMLKTIAYRSEKHGDSVGINSAFSPAQNQAGSYPHSLADFFTSLRKNSAVREVGNKPYTGVINLSTGSYSSSYLYI